MSHTSLAPASRPYRNHQTNTVSWYSGYRGYGGRYDFRTEE